MCPSVRVISAKHKMPTRRRSRSGSERRDEMMLPRLDCEATAPSISFARLSPTVTQKRAPRLTPSHHTLYDPQVSVRWDGSAGVDCGWRARRFAAHHAPSAKMQQPPQQARPQANPAPAAMGTPWSGGRPTMDLWGQCVCRDRRSIGAGLGVGTGPRPNPGRHPV